MSDVELLRATLLHTPANPFKDERALACHEDGGLLVEHGRIVASGDYTAVRATCPLATTIDWRGGILLPGLVDTHLHYPQLRIIGGLGRTLLDWLEQVALPEEARISSTPSPPTGRRRRWSSVRISRRPPPRCLKRRPTRDSAS